MPVGVYGSKLLVSDTYAPDVILTSRFLFPVRSLQQISLKMITTILILSGKGSLDNAWNFNRESTKEKVKVKDCSLY